MHSCARVVFSRRRWRHLYYNCRIKCEIIFCRKKQRTNAKSRRTKRSRIGKMEAHKNRRHERCRFASVRIEFRNRSNFEDRFLWTALLVLLVVKIIIIIMSILIYDCLCLQAKSVTVISRFIAYEWSAGYFETVPGYPILGFFATGLENVSLSRDNGKFSRTQIVRSSQSRAFTCACHSPDQCST